MTGTLPTPAGAARAAVLHQTARRPARSQRQHDRKLPGQLPAARQLRRGAVRKGAGGHGRGGHRHRPGRGLSRTPRDRTRQQCPEPQPAPCRHPFLLPAMSPPASPQVLHHCQKILQLPGKRHDKATVTWLTEDEIKALVAAPDLATWYGRRDRALLALAAPDPAFACRN